MIRLLFLTIMILLLPEINLLSSEEIPREEEIVSITVERRETLNYGIETEVVDLLKKLSEEKDINLISEVGEVFNSTSNGKILQACLEYFLEIKIFRYTEKAIALAEDYDNLEKNLVSLSLKYISEARDTKGIPVIEEILDLEDPLLVQAAVTALGKLGSKDQALLLMEKLEDEFFPAQAKPEIIRTLGELKFKEALPQLISILNDTTEQPSWRWYACEALGKMGDPEGLEAIKNVYTSADPTLRSYIVSAMQFFKPKEVEDFLIEALRDSFWRVRVQAASSLGEIKSLKALDILKYKASKDPENNVRIASIKALGALESREGYDFLQTLLLDEKTPLASRQEVILVLIAKDLESSLSFLETIITKEWEKDKSRLLDTLGKGLSTVSNPSLAPIFEKMLSHKELTIKIYALRGIALNRITSLRGRVEELTEKGVVEVIRKNALSTLESLE